MIKSYFRNTEQFGKYDPIFSLYTEFNIAVGYYDDTGDPTTNPDYGELLDVTNDSTYEVLDGSEANLISLGEGNFRATALGTYRLRFIYGDEISTFTFCVVEDIDVSLTADQLYAIAKTEEPEGVYTQQRSGESLTYCDNYAFAQMLEEFYDYMVSSFEAIYPELTTDSDEVSAWEYTTTGQYNLYDPANLSTPKVLQFLRNSGFSLNPYDVAVWISQYIYLRSGLSLYVYPEEFNIDFSLDYWQLGISGLGTGTILAPSTTPSSRKKVTIHVFYVNGGDTVSEKIQNELSVLITRWGRASVTYSFIYGENPAEYGFVQPLEDTYKGDPRIGNTYCLRYYPYALEQVIGLANPFATNKLISVTVYPVDGSTLYLGATYGFFVIGTFEFGYIKNLTSEASFTSLDPDYLVAEGTHTFQVVAVPVDPNTVSLQVVVRSKVVIAIYPVEIPLTPEWELGVSMLGVDTILT